MSEYHRSIMSEEVVNLLACRSGGTYVDCTLGGGGHALAILEASSPDGRLIGFDRDTEAIKRSEEVLKKYKSRVTIIHSNFKELGSALSARGVRSVDGILADLGVSSSQLDKAERGFSFMRQGPLDMRMDQSSGERASELLARLSVDEVSFILKTYGEERWARLIAVAIKERDEIKTTSELAELVEKVVPRKFHPKKIHVATRTFQALRIAVNEELVGLEEFLATSADSLKKGGRIAVISFHSLEDRVVKHSFKALSKGCICPPDLPYCRCNKEQILRIITKKAVLPSEDEIKVNPRSRSARLRVAERL